MTLSDLNDLEEYSKDPAFRWDMFSDSADEILKLCKEYLLLKQKAKTIPVDMLLVGGIYHSTELKPTYYFNPPPKNTMESC